MYTLHDLLEEAAQQKLTSGKKGCDFQQVWDAFNRYATSVMEKRQTLSLANFCKIGWRIEEHSNGKGRLRPHFQVADSFARAYNLDIRGCPPVAERLMAAVEEFNFSKAAIRFTQNVSKDSLFIGLRAIIHTLGEVMSYGQTVAIDFEVGRLVCSDRAVSFAFAAELYLREGLEVPTDSLQESGYKPSATFVPPSKDALTLNLAGSNRFISSIKAHSGFLGGGWSEEPEGAAAAAAKPSPRERELPGTVEAAAAGATAAAGAGATFERKAADGASDAGATEVGGYPASQLSTAYDLAQTEALDRHIAKIGEDAAQAIAEKEQWDDHVKRCHEEEHRDREYKRALAREHAGQLREQIAQAEQRRSEGRQFVIEQASQHDFPNFSEIPERAVFDYLRERRSNLKEDLDQQVELKHRLKTMARQREFEQDYVSAEATKRELALQKLEAAVKREQEKTLLHQSWDKDKRLHNVRRAIEDHHKAPAVRSNLTGLMGSPATAAVVAAATSAGGPGAITATLPLPSPRGADMGSSPGAPSRPPTGAVRRVPFGAAASLALNKDKLASTLRR